MPKFLVQEAQRHLELAVRLRLGLEALLHLVMPAARTCRVPLARHFPELAARFRRGPVSQHFLELVVRLRPGLEALLHQVQEVRPIRGPGARHRHVPVPHRVAQVERLPA